MTHAAPHTKSLAETVDFIISCGGDFEAAHSMEDDLHIRLLRQYAPPEVLAELERLAAADFPRYCA